VSHCSFSLSYHVNGDEIAQQSVDWLNSHCPDLNPKQRHALSGLQAGELTAYCYHTATPERLRVVSDFMNYLFHLCVHDDMFVFFATRCLRVKHVAYACIAFFFLRDNISDGMMTRETDVLADVVMNALWFCEKYMPTRMPGKEQANEELNPGKLARK
jgi:hypothetical protein